jgi:hypothetical protein
MLRAQLVRVMSVLALELLHRWNGIVKLHLLIVVLLLRDLLCGLASLLQSLLLDKGLGRRGLRLRYGFLHWDSSQRSLLDLRTSYLRDWLLLLERRGSHLLLSWRLDLLLAELQLLFTVWGRH